MSKSVGNIVDPNHLIDTYGADTARLFSMFASPPEQSLEWSDTAVEGSYRFLKRVWAFTHEHLDLIQEINDIHADENNGVDWDTADAALRKSRQALHQLLAQATHDYERQQFNTVVSAAMKIFNELSALTERTELHCHYLYEGISILLRLLAPITPHICHHLWLLCGFDKAIIDSPWPKVDKSALKTDMIEYVVQVNGKLRAQFIASAESSEEDLLKAARIAAAAFLADKTERKAIVVSHRQLINLVVA